MTDIDSIVEGAAKKIGELRCTRGWQIGHVCTPDCTFVGRRLIIRAAIEKATRGIRAKAWHEARTIISQTKPRGWDDDALDYQEDLMDKFERLAAEAERDTPIAATEAE